MRLYVNSVSTTSRPVLLVEWGQRLDNPSARRVVCSVKDAARLSRLKGRQCSCEQIAHRGYPRAKAIDSRALLTVI